MVDPAVGTNITGMLVDATDIAAFLKSPKMWYWQRLYNGTGIVPAKPNIHFVFGSLWSEFVADFYAQQPEGRGQAETASVYITRFMAMTKDFPAKERDPLTKALEALIPKYYQNFSPDDGVRTESEVEFVWNGFCGRVDGEGVEWAQLLDNPPVKAADGHECKATSRAASLADQVWYYQNSIQIKLYAVARQWDSVVIELAFKDPPYDIFRAPAMTITADMRADWQAELTLIRLAMINCIRENNFLCNPQSCNIVGKRGTWMCDYKPLCEGRMDYLDQFKPREEHLKCRT